MNQAYASAGKLGGFYALPREAAMENEAAASVLESPDLVFDVQGHFVNPTGAWTRAVPPGLRYHSAPSRF